MELDADLQYWRTVTPSYSSYEFNKSDPGGAIDKDNSPAAKALRAQFFSNVRDVASQPALTVQRSGKIVVEIEKATKASGLDRAVLAQTIAAWEMRGLLSNVCFAGSSPR